MSAPSAPSLIRSQDALTALCERLSGSDWFALDTEFMRERTYYPQLCLIQIATPDRAVAIDPLAGLDLAPLFRLLHDPQRLKVLHAAWQDLEILAQASGTIPQPIFDTQIAAQLLGQGEQIGYGRLVEQALGVTLDKSQARTDWSRRPLRPAQLRYALEDVVHLATLYERQVGALRERDRLDWVLEDCRRLFQSHDLAPDPDALLRRVRGARRLPPREQALARELAVWRETVARREDKPRKWVLSDEAILDLVQALPTRRDELQRLRSLRRPQLAAWGDELLARLQDLRQRAGRLAAEAGPATHTPLTPEEKDRLRALQEAVAERAAALDLPPGALASRRDLERLLRGARDVPLLTGWRWQVAGQALAAQLPAAAD